MELVVELKEVSSIKEVDETVSHVALVLGITGQIEEIIGIGEDLIDFLGELLNRVFVGDISDHYRRPRIILYIVDLNGIGRAIFELLEAILLAVVHIVLLALLVGSHIVTDWMYVYRASVALLK